MRLSSAERRVRALVLALATAFTLSSCASTPVDEVRISVKRIALSLAFEDEDKAQPVSPQRLIQIIPAPPELLATGDLNRFRTTDVPLPPEKPLCATAPGGTALTKPVAITIDEPPKPGWYRRFNRGKVGITGGPLPITVPLPRITFMEIRDVHQVERGDYDHRPADIARDEAPPLADAGEQLGGTVKVTRFTVAHQIATINVTDVYEYDDAGFRLVQRTTKTDAATSVFSPSPQLTLVTLGDFGGDWTEGGADRESSIAMTVEGAITAQEPVDLCGTLVDSLRFENDEQTVNLSTQETAGTSDVPNKYNISPQHNGLIVREEKHFTQVATVDDLKIVLDWDYVSTLGHLEPFPTREAAMKGTFR